MIDFTYRQSIEFIRRDDQLTADQKSALLGGNAARLYGLSEPTQPRLPAPVVTEG
jgi:hypothetical protein